MGDIQSVKMRITLIVAPLLAVVTPNALTEVEISAADGNPPETRRTQPMIDEVVVRAQRREQSLRDVPIAVTAMTGSQLKDMGIADARDLDTAVPGLTVSDGGYGTPVYTLRGVGFNDSSYLATPTTAVYLDEVNLPYSIMSKGPIIDVQQVEILKGPQGTLFGRSTTGGLINFIPRSPTETFEAGATISYSRFETWDIEAFASGAIVNSLRYRVAGRAIERQEGWQYSNTDKSKTHGEKTAYAIRGLFDWDATEDLSFRLMLNGWRDRSDAQAGQPIAFIQQNTSPGADPPQDVQNYPLVPQNTNNMRVMEFCKGHPSCTHSDFKAPLDFTVDDELAQVALKAQWLLNPHMEANILASYTRFEADDSQFPTGAFNQRMAELHVDAIMEVVELEARLNGSVESWMLDWLVGIHATPKDRVDTNLKQNYGRSSSVMFPVGETGETLLTDTWYPTPAEADYESIAPYANIEWQFLETLKLTLGARYTEEERSFSGCVAAREGNSVHALFQAIAVQRALEAGTEPGEANFDGGCMTISEDGQFEPFSDTIKDEHVSYRAVLDWTPMADYMFYVSHSRGFKSASFPINNAADQRQIRGAEKERVDAYELGAKTTFFDNRLQVNSAIFYYDYKDKQLLSTFVDPVFGALPALANAPESKVEGVEMDFQASPLHGLTISGAIAYIETEVKKFPNAFDTRGNPVDLSGTDFNFAPKLTYSLHAGYTYPILSAYELSLSADYSYKDETNSTLDNDPVFAHPDHAITNARIGFWHIDGRWKLTAWGKNIFNEYTVNSVFPSTSDIKFRYTGMPQTYGITFEYQYF